MAGYGQPNPEYWAPQQPPSPQQQQHHQSYNFEMPEQFGQDLYVVIHSSVDRQSYLLPIRRSYQPFEPVHPSNGGDVSGGSYYDPNAQLYAGGMFTPAATDTKYYNDGGEGDNFDNEPPLLEG